MARPNLWRQLAIMRLWLTPGMGVKRHVALAVLGTLLLILGVVGGALALLASERERLSDPIETVLVSESWLTWGLWVSLFVVLLGIVLAVIAIGRLNRSLLSNWMPRPREAAVVLHKRLSLSRGPRIVAIGGGTGLSNLLRGLRHYSSNLTAVVTASDDGGSSGRLRSAFDMPAPGDLSDCLAALSDNEVEVSRLLQYRFARGNELKGHTFGNLLITTLTEVEGDFAKAIRVLNALLNLTGAVYPVSPDPISLAVLKETGEEVRGESRVREVPGAIARVMIEPSQPRVTPEVVHSVLQADVVVLGPGSLFTSTLPPLLVPAVRRALAQAPARLVYICNIMTEAGETDGFTAFQHVEAINRHLGRYPDQVLLNSTPIDAERLRAYELEQAEVVVVDPAPFQDAGVQVISLPLLGSGPRAQHDSLALARWLISSVREAESQIARRKAVIA